MADIGLDTQAQVEEIDTKCEEQGLQDAIDAVAEFIASDATCAHDEEAASKAPEGRPGKFEMFRSDKNGKVYFHLKAGNGEIILASQGYKQKASALVGIKSVRENGVVSERFEKKESKDGKDYFVLHAKNAEPIGVSQMYKSKQGRDHGIASVMKNAVDGTPLVDKVEDRRRSRSRSAKRSSAA